MQNIKFQEAFEIKQANLFCTEWPIVPSCPFATAGKKNMFLNYRLVGYPVPNNIEGFVCVWVEIK